MFKFKGISNIAMHVIPEEEDFTARAAMQYEEISIEGRDGAVYQESNYSNVMKTMVLQVLPSADLDEIYAWLQGAGDFEYNGRKCICRFYDAAEAIRSGAIKKITVNYIRDPFWYRAKEDYAKVDSTVINRGNIKSFPLLKLIGKNGERVDITINGVRFFYTFDSTGFVEIDCMEKKEYVGLVSKSKNIEIGFEYPFLVPGNNTISINGGTCEVYIKRKDCWL